MNKKQLLNYLKKYAKANKLKLNPNKKQLNTLLNGLLSNKKQYGKIYCPCKIVTGNKQEDKNNICPCTQSKKEIKKQGHCLCRLFFKK